MEEKEQLRLEAKKIRNALDPDARVAMSKDIATRVLELPWFRESQQILVYLGIRSEVETRHLMTLAWEADKQIFVPQIEERTQTMTFYRIEPDEVMKAGAFGIPAPQPVSSRKADMGRSGMIVCPCLGFDRNGGRLGYGAGFFDRFLDGRARGWKKVAVAFSAQEFESIPTEQHDTPMQAIVTEKEIIRIERRTVVR